MSKRDHKNYFAYRSFWKEFDAMRDFTAAGFDLFTIFPSNTANSLGEPYSQYKPLWHWYETYDFAPFDEQIRDVLAINPDAKFLCMIDLNTPLWLHRQLACGNRLGADSFSSLTDALCDPRWRTYTEKYAVSFVDYAEKKYGDRIRAYIPACGVTDEWMDYSGGVETPQKLAAYQTWAKDNLPEIPRCIPCCADRFASSHLENRLRDPEKNADALAYWKFHSELVAQGILDFAKLIKEHCLTPKDVGVFYGYINELESKRIVQCGHLAYEKVLASPDVDFLISPGMYHDRKTGGFGGFMPPNGTIHRYGKRYMHECDQRTSTFNRKLSPHVTVDYVGWENTKADVAGVRREFARSLIHGTSLWMFDMWGGFYKSREVLDALHRCREIWEDFDDETREPVSEVALIADPASVLYVNDDGRNAGCNSRIPLLAQLNKLGAPYTVFSFDDIPHIKNAERFKLFLFPDLYEITEERLALLKKHVLHSDRHVMWGAGCGCSDGKGWNDGRMAEICGVSAASPVNEPVSMGSWFSCYMGAPEAVTPSGLKAAAARAGVHLYAEEAIPVFASEDLLMVHSADSGKTVIRLPEKAAVITELFEGKLRFENTDTLELDIHAPETLLFEVKKS
ncbi:MAG: hypothetical protein J5944_06760 [Lentisphaeria bacterium]|nr:hypothetical protein [Lentisphaeria bacterium]